MNKPAFYKSPPRWHVSAALIAAVAIELAAVAAGNLSRSENNPTVTGSGEEQPFEGVLIADEPEPPPPDDSPPLIPPPPADRTDFILVEPTPPPRSVKAIRPKPTVRASVSKAASPAVHFGRARMTFSPHPSYPFEARRARQTDSGKFLLRFDDNGNVTEVGLIESTGSPILDQVAMRTLRQWRCQPGAYESVYVPVTFTLHGAQL